MTDLHRWNLLEVEYAPYAFSGTSPRKPTLYTPNALYDPLLLDKKFMELKNKVGADHFERARAAAVFVYKDNDVRGIEEILKLSDQYGWERIDAALDVVRVKKS